MHTEITTAITSRVDLDTLTVTHDINIESAEDVSPELAYTAVYGAGATIQRQLREEHPGLFAPVEDVADFPDADIADQAHALLLELRSLADIHATGAHAENVLGRIREALTRGSACTAVTGTEESNSQQLFVDMWNQLYPVGTEVAFWSGIREGAGRQGVTTSPAWLLGDHTPVVTCSGYPGGIALTHVQPATEQVTEHA